MPVKHSIDQASKFIVPQVLGILVIDADQYTYSPTFPPGTAGKANPITRQGSEQVQLTMLQVVHMIFQLVTSLIDLEHQIQTPVAISLLQILLLFTVERSLYDEYDF